MKIYCETMEDVRTLKKMKMGKVFIEHIQRHLDEDKYKDAEPKGKIICKICGKTVEQIYEVEK